MKPNQQQRKTFATMRTFFTLTLLLLLQFSDRLSAQYVNIPVTGFNNDIVANGTGATNTVSSGTLPGVTQPTIGVDGNGPGAYSFIDATYKWYSGSTAPTCFMPTGGAVPSALTSGLTYQLQDYSNLNALTVVSNTYAGSVWPTSGSISLASPASYGNLYVLYESVLNTAGPTVTATVTFTDASTQVFAGNSVVNWFTATGVAYTPSLSRAQNAAPGNPGACATGPYLFQMTLPLSPANYSKQVQSISFNWSAAIGSSVNTVDYFHVLALGGIAPCVTPADQPTSLNLTSPNGTTIGGTFTAASSAPSGYITVAYLSGSTPTNPVSGTTYTVGSALGAGKVIGYGATTSFSGTGLYPGISYDIYVYSYNSGSCATVYNTVSPLFGTITTSSIGSSLLINPYTDGGFETGTTLAANGWSVVNSATNQWVVGTVPTGFNNRTAYISNNGGGAWAYTNTSVTASHIYKDVTFPAGQSDITLSFNWKALGETSSWDAIVVYYCSTTVTPVNTSPTGTGNTATWTGGSPVALGSQLWNQGTNMQTFSVCLPAAFAGTTQRIVITWKNDGTAGTSPPAAVDNIAIVSSTPASPADQATNLVLTPISTSQINGSFTAATSLPTGYVVVRYPNGAAVTNPANGTSYTVGQALGLGTVISVGTSTTFSSTGLLGGTSYDFYVYDYLTGGCSGNTYNVTSPLTLTQSTNPCGTISGVIPVGPTAPASPAGFPTLTGVNGALTYITTNGLGGNTILELQPDYTTAYAAANETYPITFNLNPCINASKTLTIRPEATVPAPITLTSASTTLATIVMDGASYITFDGRPGGTGSNKYLRIVNTSATAAAAGNAFMMRNEASNNLLTYLDIQSSNLNPATNAATVPAAGAVPGAVAILSTTGTNGNDNNTISFCDIHSATSSGNLLNVGVFAVNATTLGNASNNDGCTITDNNIYDIFNASTATAGIDICAGNNNWVLTNNSYYKSAGVTYTYTGAVSHRGFWVTPNASAVASSGFVITGNYIGGTAPLCGGSAFTSTAAVANIFNGMDISVGTLSFTSVQNNTITNFNHTTANTGSTAWVGLNLANGNLNIGTVTGNVIGSTTINGAITFTATANTGGLIGIRTGGGTTINISNNIVSGITLIGSATVTPVFNGINGGGGTTVNIVNNTIGSTTLANSINATSAYTGTSVQTIRGIIVNAGTSSTVTGNTIANMNTNLTSTSGAHTVVGVAVTVGTSNVSGNTIRNLTSTSQSTSGGSAPSVIGISYTSTTAPAVISGNTIHTLKNVNTTTTSGPVVAGIYYGGASGTTNVIEKNNIHSLVLSSNTVSSSAAITGMDIATGQCTIRNNMIRLGYDENGNSIVVATLIRGISKNTNIANVYNNSIYIGGTGVLNTVAANSFAFTRTAAAATDDIRNNIFVNNRSNATTGGKHYQINLTSTATLTLNYNDYYGTGTGTVFGFNGTADVAAYSAGWVSGDVSSQAADPQFINPTGSAATGDLHIDPINQTIIEQNGINISSVTDDFDGQSRAGLTPDDMGADAGNFNGFFCAGPPASATAVLAIPAQVCGNVAKTINLTGFTPTPGYTYQWQESVSGLPGTFTNVTGGTGANAISYTTALINSSMYYQCEIGCAFGAGTTTSSSVFADILPAPVLTVTPTTGTNVCSGANVDLSASGANTYVWTVNPGVSGYPVVSLLTTKNNLANVTSRPTATLSSSTANPPATTSTPTWTYTVVGTAANGCTSSSAVVLNVITTPVVPVQLTYTNSPDPVCSTGVPVTFTVNNPGTIGSGNWIYNWYDQSGTTLLQSTTTTSSTDTYTPTTPVVNGNYIYQVRASNTACPASYAVASPSYYVGYTSLNVVSNANCGDNGVVTVYPEGQNSFTTWYSNDFNVGLLGPAFDASFGNTNFTGGRANITPMALSQTGALVIRNSSFINSNNLRVDFKMSTAPRGFAFNILGADGMCWSYGGDVTVGTVTTGGQGEGGSGTGLKLAFDATSNGPNNLPGAYLMYNCTVVGQGPGDPGVLAYKLGSWWQGLVDAPVSIIISQNGFVTVTVNNEVIFDHIALPAAYLTANKSNWIHSFTARTGGSNELHAIDDLNIRYNSYEYSNNSTTGLDGTWQSSNTFTGLAAGTYPMWVRSPSNPTCVSNVGNAVVGTSPSPSSAVTVAAPGFNTTICAGSSTDLTTDVSIPGATFLWESSSTLGGPYSPAAGTNNTAIYSTGTILSSAYYRCTFTCPSSSPITSTPVLVTVNSGSIASTNSPVTVNCLNSSATVTATPGANTTIVWYSTPTGGSPLASGNSYTVTPSTYPSTYYAEPVTTAFTNHYDFGGEKSVGGNLNGGSSAGTGISSRFSTSASIRIDSIKVLPNAAGTLTVALQTAGSATNISSFNLTISAAQVGTFVNVPVNFVVAGSGNYQLTTTGVSCSYNPTYPAANYSLSYMSLGGVFTIVGGSTSATGTNSTTVYGTAYNWSITTSCPTGGARVAVVVDLNPTFAVSVTPPSASNLCGSVIQPLTASSSNPYSSYTWSPVNNLFADAAGTIPLTLTDNQATVYFKGVTAGSTTYTVSTAGTGCTNLATTTVSAVPSPSTPVITQNPLIVCGNNPVTLVASSTQPGEAQIGTGTSTNSSTGQSPYSGLYEGSNAQYLFTAAELNAQGVFAGPLTSIAFNVTSATTTTALNGYNIKIGTTASTALSAYTPGLSQVYSGTGILPVSGWNTYNFSTPFVWDGSSNLIVEVCSNNDPTGSCSGCWSSTSTVEATTTAFNSVYGSYDDNITPVTNFDPCGNAFDGTPTGSGTVSTARPNIKLGYGATTNFLWSTGGTDDTLIVTPPTGSTTYSVVVSNNAGCTATDSVTVNAANPPTPYIATNDTSLCAPSIIDVVVADAGSYSGGYPAGTTFEWFTVGGQIVPPTPDLDTIPSSFGSTYYTILTLPNGCTARSDTASILTKAVAVVDTIVNASCSGSGSILATVTSGLPPYNYVWSTDPAQTNIIRNVTSSSNTDTLTNIPAGTYYLNVADESGSAGSCNSGVITLVVGGSSPIVISLDNLTTPLCNGTPDGSATISYTGGTAPISVLWSTGATTNSIAGLVAGTYTVTVSDNFGCADTLDVIVTEPALLTATLSSTPESGVGAADGTVTAVVSGGTPGYSIDWYDLIPNYINSGSTIGSLGAGFYQVFIQDANACQYLDTVEVTVTSNMTLNLTLLIEGMYDGSGGLVPALLNGGVGTSSTECDTIHVELRDQTSPTTVLGSGTVVLGTNGQASVTLPSTAIGATGYIAVFHRNAVETWSDLVTFSATTNYNFTTAASQAYGSNQKEVATGVWAFYSGDLSPQDGLIDVTDQGLIDNDIFNFVNGYVVTDITGDNLVDVTDQGIVDNNIFNFIGSLHP